ncbi:hypothetical protein GALL_67680 [mine drainage metagenome]|uniref:Competence protein CoiA-like N-terminal domain-containing protein n=1 Tax=mine drainage metagenome TaxID=410659 RepID=A0A1J5STV0_9ZZZZ
MVGNKLPTIVKTDRLRYIWMQEIFEASMKSSTKWTGPVLSFALRKGIVVHIDEVENGLGCGCICPACRERLVAKQGTETAHHFSHEGGSDCKGGVQTALHLAAKSILSKEMKMILPALLVRAVALDKAGKMHEGTFELPSQEILFSEVSEEVRFGNVIPDIAAKVGEKKLFIEIAVCHFVDDVKLQKLAEIGVSTIEIDLSDMADEWNWDNLRNAVLERTDNKVWLFNKKTAALTDRARMRAVERAQNSDKQELRRVKDLELSFQYQRASAPGFRAAVVRLEELLEPTNLTAELSRLNSEGARSEAWITAARMLRIQWDTPPSYINIEVPHELGILVDRRVWQAAVFNLFIRWNQNKSFSPKVVIRWCLKTFPRRKEFDVLQKYDHLLTSEQRTVLPRAARAISAYLHELVNLGYLKVVNGRYVIMKKAD